MQTILNDPDLELAPRLDSIMVVLDNSGSFYREAKDKLADMPASRLELAIRKQGAGLRLLNGSFLDSLKKAEYTHAHPNDLLLNANLAIKDYIAWCNSQLIEQAAQDQGLK